MMNIKETNSRLIRWKLTLAEFDHEITYKQGKEHDGPDALSRLPLKPNETGETECKVCVVTRSGKILDTTKPTDTRKFSSKTTETTVQEAMRKSENEDTGTRTVDETAEGSNGNTANRFTAEQTETGNTGSRITAQQTEKGKTAEKTAKRITADQTEKENTAFRYTAEQTAVRITADQTKNENTARQKSDETTAKQAENRNIAEQSTSRNTGISKDRAVDETAVQVTDRPVERKERNYENELDGIDVEELLKTDVIVLTDPNKIDEVIRLEMTHHWEGTKV